MTFIATYQHPKLPAYCRTVYADSLNEASKRGEKYARKGYIMVKLIQRME